jgi:hypothetical protein
MAPRMYMGHLRTEAEIAHMEKLRARIDAPEPAPLSPTHALADRLSYLYGRWLDEREYEDFADYEAAAAKAVAEFLPGATFVSLKRRPFELRYRGPGSELKWMRATSRDVSWGTVKAVRVLQ